jgi:hypothetical protein
MRASTVATTIYLDTKALTVQLQAPRLFASAPRMSNLVAMHNLYLAWRRRALSTIDFIVALRHARVGHHG